MPNLLFKSSPSSFPINLFTSIRVAAAIAVSALCFLAPAVAFVQQEQKDKKQPSKQEPARKEDGKVPTEKDLEKAKLDAAKVGEVKLTPAEAAIELAIIAYGGRKQLGIARANIQEAGTIRLATEQGDLSGNYLLRSIRKDKSSQDLLRVDLELSPAENAQGETSPPIKYVIGFNGASVWSAQNGQYVSARAGADIAFRAQLTHEYMALLRYKEDGSKLDYIGLETLVGVSTFVVDLTSAEGEKTRFWLSARTYRVIRCEYELKLVEGRPPTKYRIDYYYTPFSAAVIQNTLVPVRREMKQDEKFVQEIKLTNILYSAKLDPEIFQHLQEQ